MSLDQSVAEAPRAAVNGVARVDVETRADTFAFDCRHDQTLLGAGIAAGYTLPYGCATGTFPKLKIVCCHGFYPRVADMVTVAFRNENVFVSPDMYTFMPGGALYIDAANGFMRDQFLFGSSYPFRPMRQGVDDFHALGLTEEAFESATYRTASRLLGLEPAAASTLAR